MMNIQRKRALRVLGFSLIAGLVVVWAVRSVFNAKHSAAELERVVVLNPSDNGSPPHRWPVHINVPQGPPRVQTESSDWLGRMISVSCASCHSNFEPNPSRRSSTEPPMTFHAGLVFDHGGLSCNSCHNANDYNTLRLADGAAVEYRDVMTMCAQCHAPQARDFQNGAHGGMTGFWDLSRGPQFRKSCIDCHDPHKPAFPTMTPTFKPIDRFLETPEHHETHR